jgi:hypothetical protein
MGVITRGGGWQCCRFKQKDINKWRSDCQRKKTVKRELQRDTSRKVIKQRAEEETEKVEERNNSKIKV